MATYDYSYTTIDLVMGQARTFSITTDSRKVAMAEIRRSVMAVNRKRLAAGEHRLLQLPTEAALDANAPSRGNAILGRVALYA